jgi:Ser/Thr protein kinase RdoA (MazF antagonist)
MSGTAKTHGMDKTRVKPDWPPLTLAEVRALLSRYPGCGEPIEILSVSPRPFSAASVVSTSSGRVFIKRHHHSVRNAEGLLEEHRFMSHLRAHGAGVPLAFTTDAAETAVEVGEWTYEVHDVPAGADPYEDALSWTPFFSVAHAHAVGRALAHLHLAAKGFNAPARKVRPLVSSFTIFADESPADELTRYIEARPALAASPLIRSHCDEALELLAPFHARLLPLLPALAPLWTHNDLHASNLLWSDNGDRAHATAIIDFGLADRTNAVHDLAVTIERNIVEWLELRRGFEEESNVPVHMDQLKALLDGYDQVRPLSAEEAAALVPMTALCHAEFALTEADYFYGVLRSEKYMLVCTDGYLRGHARWYRSTGGRILLEAIARWADTRQQKKRTTEQVKVGEDELAVDLSRR